MPHDSNNKDSGNYGQRWPYRDAEGLAEMADPDGDNLEMKEDARMRSGLLDREKRGFAESKRSDEQKKLPHMHERDPHVPQDRKIKKETEEIEAESGKVIRKIPLAAVKLDPNVYPVSWRRQPPVKKQLQSLLAGAKLPPLKVMEAKGYGESNKRAYILVDGYGTWRAYQRRAKDTKTGKLTVNLSQVELETIQVQIVDGPEDGRFSSKLKNRIRRFYQEFPGRSERQLARELRCDIKTVKKYAADLIEQWKTEEMKIVQRMISKGMPSRLIARQLREKWPYARGLSQPTISRMIRVARLRRIRDYPG